MKKPVDTEPKQPVVVDMRSSFLNNDIDKTSVQMLVEKEKADAIQVAAEKLGTFAVKILAEEGDPFVIIRDTENQKGITSPEAPVPANKVILDMRNTVNPHAPTDLAGLWHSLDSPS